MIWGLLPLALIGAGAWFISKPALEEKLAADAQEKMKAAGYSWAAVEVAGRDARLTGAAPSHAAITGAAEAALSTWGVRRVDASGAVVKLGAPTVARAKAAKAPVILSGAWPEAPGASLSVAVAGKTYVLGKDGALASDGKGKWTLKLDKLPADGVYDVAVTVTDDGTKATDGTSNELLVDTTPPAAPVLKSAALAGGMAVLAGTWPEGDAKSLMIGVGEKTYTLGKDGELTSDGKGNWKLAGRDKLADGAHDVTMTVADAMGNKTVVKKAAALVVDTKAPAAPAVVTAMAPGGMAVIKGTWAEGDAKSLKVSLAGKTYELGKTNELTSDGKGNWTLKPKGRLADGVYDITLESADAAGNVSRAKAAAALRVDATPPAAPALSGAEVKDGFARLAGTWDSGDAKTLTAKFDGRTYQLGKDAALKDMGGGKWVLAPGYRMRPGVYSLWMQETDAAGNSVSKTFKNVVVIAEPKPKPKPVAAPKPKPAPKPVAAPKPKPKPVADTTPPATPTVVSLMTRKRRPLISGSWPSSDAKMLKVELAGKTYRKGFGMALRSKGDSWTLRPDKPLADGVYDVKVTVADAAGNEAVDASRNELTVDATSPAAPTVRPQATLEPKVTVRGTWPEGDARTLTVSVNGKSYVLGAPGSPLKADGKGRWVLRIPGELAPGAHDVKAVAADALGNASHDQTVNEIVVKAPPKVVAPAPAEKTMPAKPKISCQVNLDKVMTGAKIHFETDKARIAADSMKLIDDLAKAANSCPKAAILVAGHTDSRGSDAYNQALSERRAVAVVKALAARGVSPSRLSAVGYGEKRPIADNKTKEGRARNRRIEFIVTPVK